MKTGHRGIFFFFKYKPGLSGHYLLDERYDNLRKLLESIFFGGLQDIPCTANRHNLVFEILFATLLQNSLENFICAGLIGHRLFQLCTTGSIQNIRTVTKAPAFTFNLRNGIFTERTFTCKLSPHRQWLSITLPKGLKDE